MVDPEPWEQELLDRIIVWREAGWTFQEIGAQLEREGFDPKHAEYWQREIIRQLVRQRKS